jgi:hypothetical protein
MFTPYLMPGEFEATTPPNATMPQGTMDMGGMMSIMAQPHISFAGWIVGMLALKYFTESNLISVDPQEVKISLLNILSITLQAGFGFVGLKVLVGWLLQRGVMIPGLADFVGAF